MPKLYASKHIVRVLELHGFSFVSQKGSHMKYCKMEKGITTVVIVPANRKEIPFGTFHSIVRQSKLDKKISKAKMRQIILLFIFHE